MTAKTRSAEPANATDGADAEASSPPVFGYSINLDERGDFYADVRDPEGKTVFEIKAGSSLDEDESSIFEDGYMRDKNDLGGLAEHLRSMGVMPKAATLVTLEAQEEALAERSNRGMRPR